MASKASASATDEPFAVVTRPFPGVALMTMNRPKTLNAMTAMDALEMAGKVAELNKDESVRCVVLTGAGRGFCAGADMSGGKGGLFKTDAKGERIKLSPGQGIALNMEKAYNPAAKGLYELEKPLVVAVNGTAAGGGVGIALLGDIIVAAENAKFINVFAPKVALAPDLATTWTLPRLVGRGRAMAMSLLGEPISAKEAVEIGMIYKAVPDADLMKEALAIAQKLAQGPTVAFVETRRLFDSSWTQTVPQQLDAELKAQTDLGEMPDYSIGVKRFRTKGNDPFTGKRTPSKL